LTYYRIRLDSTALRCALDDCSRLQSLHGLLHYSTLQQCIQMRWEFNAVSAGSYPCCSLYICTCTQSEGVLPLLVSPRLNRPIHQRPHVDEHNTQPASTQPRYVRTLDARPLGAFNLAANDAGGRAIKPDSQFEQSGSTPGLWTTHADGEQCCNVLPSSAALPCCRSTL